jgi:hypothetical protein
VYFILKHLLPIDKGDEYKLTNSTFNHKILPSSHFQEAGGIVYVQVEKLKILMENRDWTLPQLAAKMALDYSFLYRVMQGQRNPGGKFFSGLMLLCMEEGLDFEQYVGFAPQKTGEQG